MTLPTIPPFGRQPSGNLPAPHETVSSRTGTEQGRSQQAAAAQMRSIVGRLRPRGATTGPGNGAFRVPRRPSGPPAGLLSRLLCRAHPQGELPQTSRDYLKLAQDLLARNERRRARRTLSRMFDSVQQQAQDFVAAGMLLPAPSSTAFNLNEGMLATKLFERAKELGSTDLVVYERLGELYLQLYYKNIGYGTSLKNAEDNAFALAENGGSPELALSILVPVFSSRFYPDRPWTHQVIRALSQSPYALDCQAAQEMYAGRLLYGADRLRRLPSPYFRNR